MTANARATCGKCLAKKRKQHEKRQARKGLQRENLKLENKQLKSVITNHSIEIKHLQSMLSVLQKPEIVTDQLLNQLHAEPSNSFVVHQLLAQIPGCLPDQPSPAEDGALSAGPSTESMKQENPSSQIPVGKTFSHFGSQLFSNPGGSFEDHEDVGDTIPSPALCSISRATFSESHAQPQLAQLTRASRSHILALNLT